MLLPCRPAAAQGKGQSAGWDIVYSYGPNSQDAFTGNASASGSPYAWGSLNDQYLMGGSAVATNPGGTATITGSGKIIATLTWNPHGTGQPAPPTLWLNVSTFASFGGTATGSANDGFGDAVSGGISQGTHLQGPLTVSGGVVTYTSPAITCSCSVTVPVGGNTTFLKVGHGMSVTIHAQPYNYHQTLGQDNGDGTISFTYAWLSSDGSVPHLTSCYLHERVTYPGGNPYYPPLPFMLPSPGLANPTVYPGTLTNGIAMTSTTTNVDTHYVWATSSNYSDFTNLTVSATQRYEFDDITTAENNVLVPGPDSNPTITRYIYSVGQVPYLPDWWYQVKKNGVTSSKKVMSHP